MARHGDGLYLRGQTWYLDCRINGARHVIKLGKNIKRTVAGELANVKRASILKGDAGIGKKRKDCTFDKASAAYQDWVQTNCRPRTQRVYRQQLTQLAHSFAGKLLSQISQFSIEGHKHRRVEAGAKVVANREISRLGALFNAAIKWELFEGKNPAAGVRPLEESEGRLRFLEYAEEAQLLKVASPIVQDIIVLGVHGIRISAEGLGLQWADVDFSRNLLTVQAAYAKNGQTRSIPLNSRAREVLERRHGQRRSAFVFSKPNGQPYKSRDKHLAQAVQRAGLSGTGISLHSLSHLRLTTGHVRRRPAHDPRMRRLGRPLFVQRYSHLSASHKTTAVERIAGEFHNGFYNSPVSGEVVQLAERLVSV
jgi:integrase